MRHRIGVNILLLMLVVLTACRSEPMPGPEIYHHIADSAATKAWKGEAISGKDSMVNGRFFDSVYVYVLRAVRIEGARRELTQSIGSDSILALKKLSTTAGRSNSVATLKLAASRDRLLRDSILTVIGDFRDYLESFAKDIYRKDTALRRRFPQILDTAWFRPSFRPRYDRYEQELSSQYESLIHHIEATSRRTRIDSTIRFLEDSDRTAHTEILRKIDSIRQAEASFLDSFRREGK